MSGGGGKGGSETTETTIPDWIKQPAIRNLQRAEDVQRIEYMPYYGADVAAFTPTQNAAFNANIGAGEAFGLLAPGHGLTATSGMPTPTDYDGFSGYSSQPMYESALAELKAKQPGAVAQYDALFGANVPTQRNYGGGGGGRGGGGFRPSRTPSGDQFVPNYDVSTWTPDEQRRHKEQISPTSTVSESDNAYRGNTGTGINYKAIVADMNRKKHTQDWGKWTGV
jgi:hypothetical protein